MGESDIGSILREREVDRQTYRQTESTKYKFRRLFFRKNRDIRYDATQQMPIPTKVVENNGLTQHHWCVRWRLNLVRANLQLINSTSIVPRDLVTDDAILS